MGHGDRATRLTDPYGDPGVPRMMSDPPKSTLPARGHHHGLVQALIAFSMIVAMLALMAVPDAAAHHRPNHAGGPPWHESEPEPEPDPDDPDPDDPDPEPDAPSGTVAWSSTGDLLTGRHSHTATTLPDGTVLIAGGERDDPSQPSSSTHTTEIYDPAIGAFVPGTPMPNARSRHTDTVLDDGRVLIAGGQLGHAEVYDPVSQTWERTSGMISWRRQHAATRLADGRVLITGGRATTTTAAAHASAEVFDPATGVWTATGSMSVGRLDHASTLLPDGRVLVTGGRPSQTFLGGVASAEIYDPSTGVFSPIADMNNAHHNHTATTLSDGTVLVVGAGSEVFDPATGAWQPTAGSMTYGGRTFHTALLLLDGRVLAVGGHDFTASTTAELYEVASGTWVKTGELVGRRDLHATALLEDGTVLVTGSANSADRSTAEIGTLVDP